VLAHLSPGHGKAILVGAHYDHLGRAGRGEVYWGADDNAAAVAIVLDLADRLTSESLQGELVIALFDGEEPPHFLTSEMGSQLFVEEPTIPLDRIDMAIILDLVGHAIGPDQAPPAVRNTLFVLGAEKSSGSRALVDHAAAGVEGVSVRQLDIDIVPPLSDYESFRRGSVPILFLTCGRWRHYHEVTDTPDRLDYDKIAAIADYLEALILTLLADPREHTAYEGSRHAYAESVAALLAIARALLPITEAAQLVVEALEDIAGRIGDSSNSSLSAEDWARLLQVISLMEQGLA
jgi:Zn-dependent M28 family amino/carboxypeptidase